MTFRIMTYRDLVSDLDKAIKALGDDAVEQTIEIDEAKRRLAAAASILKTGDA